MRTRFVLLALCVTGGSAAAAPYRTNDPDWPCMQIKVPELSIASVWSGPPVEQYRATWSRDPEVAEMVRQLAQRRLPLKGAEAKIVDFARQSGPDKQARLLALFAGLFDTLDHERTSVLAGLDRFGQRQKTLAADLRNKAEALRTLQSSANPDPEKVSELTQQLTWDTQVFEERRQALGYACDVPNAVEQRLFGLARAIQAQLG
jgi:hypothetical protein